MLNRLREIFAGRNRPDAQGIASDLLVGLLGTPSDVIAVRLAERLSPANRPRLVRVKDVPRDQSLPEHLDESSEERRRLGLSKSSHPSIEFTCCRNPGKMLLEIVARESPEILLVGVSCPASDSQLALLRWLLRETTTQLLLVLVSATDVIPTQLILPVATGHTWHRSILAMAARLVGPHGTIEVVGSLVVPRSMPAEAPLTDEITVLETTMRDVILGLQSSGGSVTSRVHRSRESSESVRRTPVETSPNFMVMTFGESSRDDEAFLGIAQQSSSGIQIYHRAAN